MQFFIASPRPLFGHNKREEFRETIYKETIFRNLFAESITESMTDFIFKILISNKSFSSRNSCLKYYLHHTCLLLMNGIEA